MIVSIDGPIGAGKSTLVEKLALRGYRVFVEPIEAWTLLEDFAKDPNRHAFALQIEILISYYKLLKKACQDKDSIIVIERSPWSSSKVFFDMYIDDPFKKKVYEDLYKIYGFEPDVIIYLNVDKDTSWNRVLSRGRPEETGYKEEHVKNVVDRYTTAIKCTDICVHTLYDCFTFLECTEAILKNLSE